MYNQSVLSLDDAGRPWNEDRKGDKVDLELADHNHSIPFSSSPIVAMPSAEEASWHPAFMPNSTKDRSILESTEAGTQSITIGPPKLDTSSSLSSLEVREAEQDTNMEQNGVDEKSSVMKSAPITSSESSEEEEDEDEEDADDNDSVHNGASQTEDHEDEDEDASEFPSTTTSRDNKHLSTMSFARTISGNLDFGEDDEVDSEWNINPAERDPFEDMAQTDRTNSFPPVPPAPLPALDHISQLPQSQADDIMKEVEQETKDIFGGDDDDDVEDSFFAQQNVNEVQAGSNGYTSTYGREAQDDEVESRFEEGIPLVQHHDDTQNSTLSNTGNPFGDDDGDDFFAQVSNAGPSDESTIPPLERKSTQQIMNSMHLRSQDSSEDAVKEETLESQTSLENATGGGIAASKSTIMSQVYGTSDDAPKEDTSSLGIGKESSEVDLLAEKWKAALDEGEFLEDDDELLPDDDEILSAETKPLDPADLFGSDDEFLEDADELSPALAPVHGANGQLLGFENQTNHPSNTDRYLPAEGASQPSNPYAPTGLYSNDSSRQSSASVPPSYPAIQNFQPPQQARPELPKAQSYADKSKGGYSSPYDLPMDIIKTRKRPTSSQTNKQFNNALPIVPPPRSSSVYSNQSSQPVTNVTPPTSSHSQNAPSRPELPKTIRKAQSGFFEELPMSVKPRQVRNASSFVSPSPSLNGPPTNSSLQPPSGGYSPYSQPTQQTSQPTSTPGLVAPERVSPYAAIPTGNMAVPPMASRYSPAPPTAGQTGIPPPIAQSRYSPAPPALKQIPSYTAPPVQPPAPQFAHQPRTSSPLAHFERSQDPRMQLGESQGSERRSSSSYESHLRTSHLPPTDEVDESNTPFSPSEGQYPSRTSPTTMRHSSQTPPPLRHSARSTMSPPKRNTSNYQPQQQMSNVTQSFAPPKRSQTQSPGGGFAGHRLGMNPLEPFQRPASVELPSSPRPGMVSPPMQTPRVHGMVSPPVQNQKGPQGRSRGFSQGLNYIVPTDGREHDSLQRWRGSPVFVWGVGGTLVTSFPQDVPRYGMGQTVPMIIRSPGEVKIRSIKDVDPLPERLTSFPGPLKGKSKKKEVIAWLTAGIAVLEQSSSYLQSGAQLSHQDKRIVERTLLWKILRVFIENDGILEGNQVVNKAVRDVLSPELDSASSSTIPAYATGANLSGISASESGSRTDPVDPSSVDQLRKHLLQGEREKAVWEAVDKRLWAHAMLISNTVSKDLYKQVAQEFVQKEVKNIGANTESLAALYDIFAGNFEESIDELVPPSARAGFQMVSTSKIPGSSQEPLQGLDRWRETLGLVLSNRSPDDNLALNALGKLLSGYGRAEAAHICFLFARTHAVFGGIDDPAVNFVLVGADHLRQPTNFDKEMEPILLSEVFEYGMSLVNTAMSSPHLSVYKLQHATILAEYGNRDKALQYCDAITASITAQTRRSPYYHPAFIAALEDLTKRLKQSPKDGNSSWIPKPTMDKVGGSLMATFTKFVAGGDDDAGSNASGGGSDVGPFARIAGGTPTISRSPSQADIYGSYVPTNGIPIPATKAASRYNPGAQYSASAMENQPSWGSQPRNSLEGRTSGEYRRGEPQRQNSDYRPTSQTGNNYAPQQSPLYTTQSQYSPYNTQETSFDAGPSYQQELRTPITELAPSNMYGSPQKQNSYGSLQQSYSYDSQPSSRQASGGYEAQPSAGFEASSSVGFDAQTSSGQEPISTGFEQPSPGGYEAPSGYEPPSSGYVPYEPTDEPDSPIKKKKSFMDDDDDDIPALRKPSGEKSKADKDREADEAFRKAAEADGKITTLSFRLLVTNILQQQRAHRQHQQRKVGVSQAGGVARRKSLT